MSANPIPKEELAERLRRASPRYQFRVQAEVVWQNRHTWGRVIDISRGGMFIEADNPMRVNALFTVYLAMNVPLRLECMVRRVVPGRGIGVSISVPRDMKARFDALLLALSFGEDPAKAAVPIPAAATQSRGLARAAAASSTR